MDYKLKGDEKLAQIFYSLDTNYAFLTNILRKSIYEYYIGKRYILKNQRNTSNMFEKKLQQKSSSWKMKQQKKLPKKSKALKKKLPKKFNINIKIFKIQSSFNNFSTLISFRTYT